MPTFEHERILHCVHANHTIPIILIDNRRSVLHLTVCPVRGDGRVEFPKQPKWQNPKVAKNQKTSLENGQNATVNQIERNATRAKGEAFETGSKQEY
jgi:hypothetical protein